MATIVAVAFVTSDHATSFSNNIDTYFPIRWSLSGQPPYTLSRCSFNGLLGTEVFRKYIFNSSVALDGENMSGWLWLSPVLSIIKAITEPDQTYRLVSSWSWSYTFMSSTPTALHTSLISAASYPPISRELNTRICWVPTLQPHRQVRGSGSSLASLHS